MKELDWLNELPTFKHTVLITTFNKKKVKTQVVDVEYLEELFEVNKHLNELYKSNCFYEYDLKQLKERKSLRVGYDDSTFITLTLID